MFRTAPRGTHRAPGRAVIDYRGLTAPVGRGVGGAAVIGAVSATAALTGAASATAQAPAASAFGTVHGAAPSAAPATQAQYTATKLRLGARGAAVTHLQQRLNAHGASLAVDGVFGSSTLRAVRAQQSAAGIGVDGVVGPRTWSALTGAASAPAAPSTSTNPKLRRGDRGAAVTTLQKQLNDSGASIAVDGVFGSGTAGAVRALQSAAGIGVDGVVGPKTWRALAGDARIGGSSGSSAPSTSGPSTTALLRQGDRGSAVRSLQSALNDSGASIAVDGVFGRGTASAVRALQSAAGIGVDGVVGSRTWNALNSDVRIGDTGGSRGSTGGSTSSGTSVDGNAIIAAARTQIGARYSWGGESPSTGYDCSGLVHYAYNQSGHSLPRKTAKGYVFGGRIISQSEAKPGDLVAFTGNDYGHMGIYIGNGKIIDASGSRQQVVERSIWNAPHVFVTYR
ncbi:peptidoglycan-binding protein [Brachybacterium saurashtrense]|uniref:Hydrolase n=1 Tax=Brachybacterium saurashtrense TaxID=556288 RepID=A0A345YQ57_9MICO|nr:peptidoglycan-binding protein [Brachybacterium saurashtrense]AXK46059.1 hydrolase [Brachybacterium saurashtrense]RRR23799.1 hydrolase [Brachybacterium saurashtrense]